MKLGIVMDHIKSIKVHKDSSFAMLIEAQRRGWELYHLELGDLFTRDGRGFGAMSALVVRDDPDDWHTLQPPCSRPLADLDVILMRKDPPFDMEYIYATYILERAEAEGVRVVNRAGSLRDFNEKFATTRFPQCCPPTLVDRSHQRMRAFLEEHGDIVVKPLDGMGGASIFRMRRGDPNVNVILETLSNYGQRYFMAQRFIPEIEAGDKRILLIAGEPIPYALARVPAADDLRGNLAAGATARGVELTARDRWICAEVGPVLAAAGLWFVGLDVIGDWLTEVNVTSPTCIRELDALYNLNISAVLFDRLEALPTRAGPH